MDERTGCLPAEAVEAYVLGSPSANRQETEMHAAGCQDCRARMVALGLALTPGTDAEEADLRSILATRSPGLAMTPAPFGGRRFAVAASVLAACAAGVAVMLLPGGGDPASSLSTLALGERPIEARTSLDVAWAPYRPTRGAASVDHRYDRVLGQLLTEHQKGVPEASRALAIFYLWRAQEGDEDRALKALDEEPRTPFGLNDRGVWNLARGRADTALELFDQAIAARSDLLVALFNRAIALERLGRRADAVAAWEKYMASAGTRDPGWIAEASGHLAALHER